MRAIDLKPGEEIVRVHLKLSRETFDILDEDAKKNAGDSISMWVRMLARKSRGLSGIPDADTTDKK